MSNNIEKLLAIFTTPRQDLENAFQQLAVERFIDTADGAQLDIIGRIVGQDRNALVDADYRRYIRARIAANNSDGRIEDILSVARLIVYDAAAFYQVDNQGTAALVLRVLDVAITTTVADILISFLRDTAAGGVRIILEYSTLAPSAPWFIWDTDGQGWDQGFFLDAVD